MVNDEIRKKVKKEFCDINITVPQVMLIGILFHNDEMRVSEISKKMNLSISTVSGIIDRLEEHGRVIRRRSNKDRRVVKVSLTEQFKTKVEKKHLKIGYHLEEYIKLASNEQLDIIFNGLKTLESVINKNIEKENTSK